VLTHLVARPLASQVFALCAELAGHGEDVRCCVAAGALGVATGSRDRTLRLWPYAAAAEGDDASSAAGARFGEPTIFVGHAHYVTALAWAPPGAVAGADAQQGALVSGSRDQAVFVWDVATATPLMRLTGHTQQVRHARSPRC
jgi:WD40 repeat protein